MSIGVKLCKEIWFTNTFTFGRQRYEGIVNEVVEIITGTQTNMNARAELLKLKYENSDDFNSKLVIVLTIIRLTAEVNFNGSTDIVSTFINMSPKLDSLMKHEEFYTNKSSIITEMIKAAFQYSNVNKRESIIEYITLTGLISLLPTDARNKIIDQIEVSFKTLNKIEDIQGREYAIMIGMEALTTGMINTLTPNRVNKDGLGWKEWAEMLRDIIIIQTKSNQLGSYFVQGWNTSLQGQEIKLNSIKQSLLAKDIVPPKIIQESLQTIEIQKITDTNYGKLVSAEREVIERDTNINDLKIKDAPLTWEEENEIYS